MIVTQTRKKSKIHHQQQWTFKGILALLGAFLINLVIISNIRIIYRISVVSSYGEIFKLMWSLTIGTVVKILLR